MAAIFRRGVRRQPVGRAAPPPPPATVLVRPEVVRCVASASAAAGNLETGGPLIGTVQRSWERAGERLIVSVLATVPPGPGTRGRMSSVSLGRRSEGERAVSAARWWRSVTGLDLVHLGDWHRHPSGLPEPSPGDALTAGRMRTESGGPVWLVAIAVGADRCHEDLEIEGNVARLSGQRDPCQEVAFYREVGRAELLALPIRVESAALPRLPALPWHVADPVRFAAECRLLAAAGFKTAVGSVDGETGLRLRVQRNGRSVTVITSTGYPEEQPKILDGRRGRTDGRGWSADRFLVDLVQEAC